MITVNPNEIVYCIAGTKNDSDDEFKERRFDCLKNEPIVVGTYQTTDGLTKINYRVLVILIFYKIDVSTYEKLYA
jgi:site-specific DNA recombinase